MILSESRTSASPFGDSGRGSFACSRPVVLPETHLHPGAWGTCARTVSVASASSRCFVVCRRHPGTGSRARAVVLHAAPPVHLPHRQIPRITRAANEHRENNAAGCALVISTILLSIFQWADTLRRHGFLAGLFGGLYQVVERGGKL